MLTFPTWRRVEFTTSRLRSAPRRCMNTSRYRTREILLKFREMVWIACCLPTVVVKKNNNNFIPTWFTSCMAVHWEIKVQNTREFANCWWWPPIYSWCASKNRKKASIWRILSSCQDSSSSVILKIATTAKKNTSSISLVYFCSTSITTRSLKLRKWMTTSWENWIVERQISLIDSQWWKEAWRTNCHTSASKEFWRQITLATLSKNFYIEQILTSM